MILSNICPLLCRAVSEAEKLVGYPTSLNSVRGLVDNDFANIAVSPQAPHLHLRTTIALTPHSPPSQCPPLRDQVHLRKLIGSDHPVLRAGKRLVYHGKNKMQVGQEEGEEMSVLPGDMGMAGL